MKYPNTIFLRLLLSGIGALFFLHPPSFAQKVQSLCGPIHKQEMPGQEAAKGPHFYDRFGNAYTLEELTPPKENAQTNQKLFGGDFDLQFIGFNSAERNTICAVFAYLSNFITLGPNGVRPLINVRKAPLAAGVLDSGTPYFINAGCGFGYNRTFEMMVSGGVLDYPNNIFSGTLVIGTGYNWHTTDNDPISAGQYDLFTVALHEALHIVGYSSLIGANGNPLQGFYSQWDRFLFDADLPGNLLVNGYPQPGCCETPLFNPSLHYPSDVSNGCGNQIFFQDVDAIAQINATYPGQPFNNSTVPNILSHLDRCGAAGEQYVMFSDLAAGETRRDLQVEEIEILHALGYPHPGGCTVFAVDDFHQLAWGSTIPFATLLANDAAPAGAVVTVHLNCGTLMNNANVSVVGSNIQIQNMAYGSFTLCYSIEGCDGRCDDGQLTVLNLPQLPPCQPCSDGELFCYGSFDAFLPNIGLGVAGQLGQTICSYDNGWHTSPDIYLTANGGSIVSLFGSAVTGGGSMEYIAIPLSPPLERGCSIEVCFGAASDGCTSPLSVDLYGTSVLPCSDLWDPGCDPYDPSGPYYCIGSTSLSACGNNPSTSVPCFSPLFPEEYACGNGISVRRLVNPIQLEQLCVQAHNDSGEDWNYLVISKGANSPNGQLFIDDLSVTSNCCGATNCSVELIEECKQNGVILTVLQNGVPIAPFGSSCCVSWTGIPGIPTISCPPSPGLPAQNFNGIPVSYGQSYSVTVVCNDCSFNYSGQAGQLCGPGGGVGGAAVSEGATATIVDEPLLVYPNPVGQSLHVRSTALTAGRSWAVIDQQGRTLLSGSLPGEGQVSVEAGQLPSGLYLFLLRDLDGQVVRSTRFVKQ